MASDENKINKFINITQKKKKTKTENILTYS